MPLSGPAALLLLPLPNADKLKLQSFNSPTLAVLSILAINKDGSPCSRGLWIYEAFTLLAHLLAVTRTKLSCVLQQVVRRLQPVL